MLSLKVRWHNINLLYDYGYTGMKNKYFLCPRCCRHQVTCGINDTGKKVISHMNDKINPMLYTPKAAEIVYTNV